MKFSVGYPVARNDRFINMIVENAAEIKEVYFAFGEIPNGRSLQSASAQFTDIPLESKPEMPWESTVRQLADLKRITISGISLNLLLNANCWGEDAMSRAFFIKLGDTLDRFVSDYQLNSVTTTSPLIGKFVHTNFENIDVRASVNIGIGSITAMDCTAEYFDSYYIKRELNRDMRKIREIKKWCDNNKKELYMLANSGCINDCPAQTFHDNLVAHEAKISKMDNAYSFTGICREYLKNPQNRISIIRDMNYVRPEDIKLYKGLFSGAKLATRVNKSPERVLASYLNEKYIGGITDLLEPDNGSAMLPELIDNSRLPADFGERTLNCNKHCCECGYCEAALSAATVKLNL